MEKDEHGARLAAAMAAGRLSRTDVAMAVGRDARTVTNWTSGRTMPSAAERVRLRTLLGDYDNPGDPVEVAILGSALTDDRQYEVIGFYKRALREQQQEEWSDSRRREEEWSDSRRRAIGRLRGQSPEPIAANDEAYSIDDEAEETERST